MLEVDLRNRKKLRLEVSSWQVERFHYSALVEKQIEAMEIHNLEDMAFWSYKPYKTTKGR